MAITCRYAQTKKTIYLNGVVKGFDADQNLIFEDVYEQDYWLDPAEFKSVDEAREFAVATYYNPKSVADKLISMATAGSSSYLKLSDNVLQFTRTLDSNDYSNNRLAAENNLEVSNEKVYMFKKYGVVFRTEGYTSSGEMKDLEHNFYTFNEDSVLYMKSSHYRNLQYSSAYDVTFTEYSDIFYNNFEIETALNY